MCVSKVVKCQANAGYEVGRWEVCEQAGRDLAAQESWGLCEVEAKANVARPSALAGADVGVDHVSEELECQSREFGFASVGNRA